MIHETSKEKLYLEMLNTAICGLVENEICSYCMIQHNQDHRCKNFEHCQELIFEGLRQKTLEYQNIKYRK